MKMKRESSSSNNCSLQQGPTCVISGETEPVVRIHEPLATAFIVDDSAT